MKRRLLNLLFLALQVVGILRLFSFHNREKVVILAYHGVTGRKNGKGI